MPVCPAVAPGVRGCTGPCGFLPGRRSCPGWSARWESLQAGGRGGDLASPGPGSGEPEPQPSPAAGHAARDGEDAQAQPFRFPAAGLAGQGSICVHAISSLAMAASSRHSWFWAKPFSGRFRSPVSLAQRIRSSHLARLRCRSSRSASWPRFVPVAKQVNRWPSMS